MLLKYIENFNLRRSLQSTIFKNYFFLSVYQVVYFAVPLIVVPFLIGRITVVNACDIPAFQTLLAYNEKNKYGLILILGCVINIIANIILVHLLQSLGTVYAILITESFITVGLGYYFLKVLKQRNYEIARPV
jgi:hypothetical protein